MTGGAIPFDPASMSGDRLTSEGKAFLTNSETKEAICRPKSLAQVHRDGLDQYDAIFVPGGHGIVVDGPKDHRLKETVEHFWAAGKVVAAVCHGPAGLVHANNTERKPIVRARRVTGFSNSEEHEVGRDKAVPFLLEDRLKELGGLYEKGADFAAHCVRDGQLITGQNPASSKAVADAVVEALLPGIGPQHGKGQGEGFHHRGHPVSNEYHHDHRDDHPGPPGSRSDVSRHPQAHMSQWHSPLRQNTHPPDEKRHSVHPDKSYTAT